MKDTAAKMNYCALLLAGFDKEEIKNCEVGFVDTGLGDVFNNTSELHVMKEKMQ